MAVPFTSPALMAALGIRILLNKASTGREPTMADPIVLGLFQGVGLHFAYTQSAELLLPVALGVAGKFFYEYTMMPDMIYSVSTVLGVAAGFLCTEVLSQFLEDMFPGGGERSSRSSHEKSLAARTRTVQFRQNEEEEAASRTRRQRSRQERPRADTPTPSLETVSTYVSERLDPTRTPLERELAELRAQASLADNERRRYKEERQWAVASGNNARASQMSYEVKKYTALMQSYHRQADDLVAESSKQRKTVSSRETYESRPRTTTTVEMSVPKQRTSAGTSSRTPVASSSSRAPPAVSGPRAPATRASSRDPAPVAGPSRLGPSRVEALRAEAAGDYPIPVPAPNPSRTAAAARGPITVDIPTKLSREGRASPRDPTGRSGSPERRPSRRESPARVHIH